MTPDEIETRITRLETRCTALTALVHTVLLATDSRQHHRVLAVFGHYCETMAKQLEQDQRPGATSNMQLSELATIYKGLEGALTLIPKTDAETTSQTP